MPRILYITDKFKISQGYKPAFEKMLKICGLKISDVIATDIYNLVENPLYRKGQEKVWRFDPEKLGAIKAAFDQRVRALRPDVVVVSCPAVIGVLAEGDSRLATLEKMRGGVYFYGDNKIPCVVTYPITAIHQRVDTRLVENDDGEVDTQQPYRVKDGYQILLWDWAKAARYFHGRVRRLPEFKYSICRTLEDCYAARDYLTKECVLIATDCETGNYPPGLTCNGYAGLHKSGAIHAFVIPLFDQFADGGTFWKSEDDHLIALSVIRDINESPVIKTLQNGNYDASYYIRDGLGLKAWFLDTMILWWSKYMELPKSLDFISSVLHDRFQYWKDDIKGEENEKVESRVASMERYWRYNALDCYYTLCNTLFLLMLMKNDSAMRTNYQHAFMRALSGLKMSMKGLKADFTRMAEHRADLVEAMNENTLRLRYMIDDPEFNINSGPQKVSLLYDVFGLRPRNDRGRYVERDGKGKGKSPSAGKIPIKMAKTEHPLFKYILDALDGALEPRVQMSNIFGYPDPESPRGVRGGLYLPTGRFRYSLNAVGTETTRYSGKKSNFWDGGNPQNIRGTYKDWLVADEDHIFLDVDYSQSDDVFIAYESQDPDKIAVVESGADTHAVNGELFFGIPYDKIVEGHRNKEKWCIDPIIGVRQNSKRASHGSNFQMAAMTLYVTMGREAVVGCAEILGHEDAATWDQDKLVALCGQLMNRYRRRYKRLTAKEWYKEIADQLTRVGKITNCFGDTRSFLGDPKDNGTQREATAYIGQSATAGNMNRVIYEIDHGFIPESFRDGANPDRHEKPLMMNWESHGFGFHLQVHDNYVTQLNLKHPRFREAAHNLLHVMNRPVIIHGREVRIRAEAELGLRWGKNMTSWDGKPETLDSAIAKLKFG